jgi:hypothetical protein
MRIVALMLVCAVYVCVAYHSDSLFYLHLLWSIAPRVVNWRLVTKGETAQDKLLNARYVYVMARVHQ